MNIATHPCRCHKVNVVRLRPADCMHAQWLSGTHKLRSTAFGAVKISRPRIVLKTAFKRAGQITAQNNWHNFTQARFYRQLGLLGLGSCVKQSAMRVKKNNRHRTRLPSAGKIPWRPTARECTRLYFPLTCKWAGQICTFADNKQAPIHRWFQYPPGSHTKPSNSFCKLIRSNPGRLFMTRS